MTIKSGRGEDETVLLVNTTKCKRCGQCTAVCKAGVLQRAHGAITISHGKSYGCIGCAHCAAVCPQGCIQLRGRTLGEDSLCPLPDAEKPSFDSLYALALTRRSVREYQEKEVPAELIEKILTFTATAPVQITPSNVELLVLAGREKVQSFSFAVIDQMKKWRWLFSPLPRLILRPLLSRDEYAAITAFLLPLIATLEEKRAAGEDWLSGGAPLAIYFYSAGFADPADCQVAATYAMLAGETLGLSTCLLGSVAPFIRYSRSLRQQYGIPDNPVPGPLVLFGYPSVTYRRAIKRQPGRVHYSP
ncbi:MAG: nitroreductase family protein [Negativicutes bacterium]|nr:nitroreductase family protein [Negativicutes bacterium]